MSSYLARNKLFSWLIYTRLIEALIEAQTRCRCGFRECDEVEMYQRWGQI